MVGNGNVGPVKERTINDNPIPSASCHPPSIKHNPEIDDNDQITHLDASADAEGSAMVKKTLEDIEKQQRTNVKESKGEGRKGGWSEKMKNMRKWGKDKGEIRNARYM